MDVNVQLDALEPSQKEYNRYWRDAHENDDNRYGQYPAGVCGGHSYTLQPINGEPRVAAGGGC